VAMISAFIWTPPDNLNSTLVVFLEQEIK